MELFDVYCGFSMYRKRNGGYVAKNANEEITADCEHELYAAVKLCWFANNQLIRAANNRPPQERN